MIPDRRILIPSDTVPIFTILWTDILTYRLRTNETAIISELYLGERTEPDIPVLGQPVNNLFWRLLINGNPNENFNPSVTPIGLSVPMHPLILVLSGAHIQLQAKARAGTTYNNIYPQAMMALDLNVRLPERLGMI